MSDEQTRLKQTGLIGNYWPVKMVLIFGFFVAFITYMREDLETRFMANPALNSLIIFTMVASIFMAFLNITKIRWAAMLLELIFPVIQPSF